MGWEGEHHSQSDVTEGEERKVYVNDDDEFVELYRRWYFEESSVRKVEGITIEWCRRRKRKKNERREKNLISSSFLYFLY
jgi:hypothetical protein